MKGNINQINMTDNEIVKLSEQLTTDLTFDILRDKTGLVKGIGIMTLSRLYPNLNLRKHVYKGRPYIKATHKTL